MTNPILKSFIYLTFFFIIVFSYLTYALPIWKNMFPDNPYYSYNESHTKEIFYKYDLRNNSNLSCNSDGCALISQTTADAWKELCSMDGNCNGHDAFHFWYSKNPEVEKVKELWAKLNTSERE